MDKQKKLLPAIIAFLLLLNFQGMLAKNNKKELEISSIKRKTPFIVSIHFSGDLDLTQLSRTEPSIFHPGHVPLIIERVTPIAESGQNMAAGFDIMINSATPLEEAIEYIIFIKKIEDDYYLAEDIIRTIPKRKGEIHLKRSKRNELFVKFPSEMSENKNNVRITVTRSGTKIPISINSITRTGEYFSNLIINLNKPVRHNDEITVTAQTAEGAALKAKTKVEFKKPKDQKTAKIYSTFNFEDSRGESPNILFYLKANMIRKTGKWQSGPVLELQVSTKDKNKTRKGSLLFNFHRTFFYKGKSPEGFIVDIGPKLEMDKELDNRNFLLDFSIIPLLLDFYRIGGGNGYIQPILGIEIGKNFGLEDELKVFENYSISRLTFDLNFSYKWKVNMSQIRDITFSLFIESRLLLSNETDTIDIPVPEQTEDSGETQVIKEKGFRFFLSPILSFRFSEYFALEFKYEYGERPMLFQDIRKFSIAISYSF